MKKDTSVIVKEIYPLIEKSLSKNGSALKKCIGRFFSNRHEELYDNAPYHRILFGKQEYDDFFTSINITENEILAHLQKCFFWNVAYHPPQIKEPFTCAVLMCIRYYLKKNNKKDAELCTIYLAFSGKFYASVHGLMFPKFPPNEHRPVMEYVVNNMLSDRFDLKKTGSVFESIRNLCVTWVTTYGNLIKSELTDDECGAVIQQLRDREKAFIKNIAVLYYEAYDNKDYLNYETDNAEDGENFRIVDNNSIRADRYTEQATNYISTHAVDYKLCKNYCSDQNIKPMEVKDIMESIIYNKDNLDNIKTVINIIITDFMKNNPGKDITSVDFIAYSITTKPNTKDPNLLKMKAIILSWLDENSEAYRKRKKRAATAISYYKAILQYFVITISKVVR